MKRSNRQVVKRPARGTRPANRRALILAAAAELYYRNGYANVAMKDVAEAVAIGPSALYRHFAGKEELLYAVVSDALALVEGLLDRLLADPAPEPAAQLAATMLEHRGIGALWHSEARHLSAAARLELRRQLRRIGSRLAEIVRRQRPGLVPEEADLLAWCILGVTTSVSFHSLELPADRFVRLIADMARSATFAPVPHLQLAPDPENRDAASWSPTRREAILAAATKLFALNGFASVALDDIGASVGIAGPSIYNRFDSKADILVAALTRGNLLLRADMHRQLARASGPGDALDRLLTSYWEFAFEHTDLIRLLISETDELPPDERHRMRVAQHEYVAEWVQLLGQVRPEWDSVKCRIRVQAALNVMNDVAATPHLRAFDNIAAATTAVAAVVLGANKTLQSAQRRRETPSSRAGRMPLIVDESAPSG